MFDTQIRIDLLGHVRVRLEHDEVQLGPARQRAVLAVLADNLSRLVTREELIHSIWGHSPPASADGNVHTYISGLRRVLEPERTRWSGGEVLVSEPPGYRLRLPAQSTDLSAFGGLQKRASDLQATGDHEGAVQQLDSALALWRGEAFGGIAGPYAERRRGELSEERLLVLEQRIGNLLALGEHSGLVPEIEALAHEHPLRESVWESLIVALHRDGRRMEALDRIAHLRGVLREQLGIEPAPAIQRLHQQLLAGDPAFATPEPNMGHRPKPELLSVLPEGVTRPQLAGREVEISKVQSFLSDSRTKRGRVVLVEGEVGIGKSALLAAALSTVGANHSHLAWAAAMPSETKPLGVLARALDLEQTSPLAGTDVLKHVEQLCTSAPLVLVVDDLHQVDEDSLLVWDRLSVASRSLPLLLMATCRTDAESSGFARLRRGLTARNAVVLPLRPLSRAACSQLIHQVVGLPPGPGLRALAMTAMGNPLVLRQTVATLVRDNAVQTQGGVVDLIDGRSAASAERALLASVTARLDRLSEPALETLRAAAVLGARFTTGEIAATVGRQPSQLVGVLDEAIRARVLAQVGQHLTFTHPAQRRALYDSTPPDLLPALHRRSAQSLAAAGAQVERVCDQLAAISDGPLEPWAINWLVVHDDDLATCRPLSMVWVLNQALESSPAGYPHRGTLVAARARFLDQVGT